MLRTQVFCLWQVVTLTGLLVVAGCAKEKQSTHTARPNVIIVFCDDLGYADLSSYGATDIATPYLDQLASEGIRFSNFYVGDSVCSPSRAALMRTHIPRALTFLLSAEWLANPSLG